MRHAILLRNFWVLLKSNKRTILLVIKLIKNNLILYAVTLDKHPTEPNIPRTLSHDLRHECYTT